MQTSLLEDGLLENLDGYPSGRGRGVFLLLALCVILEGVLVLHLKADALIIGGDGPEYDQLAVNILKHGVFSRSGTEPYDPYIFRTPGYPLLVAGVYAISDYSMLALRWVQFGLHLLTAYCLYLIGSAFLRTRSAVVCSLLYVTCVPFVFLPTFELTETLSTFLAVVIVLLLVRSRRRESNTIFLAVGAAAGVLILVRPSFSLLIPWLCFLVLFLDSGVPRKVRLKRCVLSVIGALILVAPWMLRTTLVAGKFVGLATGGGLSLHMSAEQYDGDITYSMPLADWNSVLREWSERKNRAREIIQTGQTASGEDRSGVVASVQEDLLVDRVYRADAIAKLRTIPIQKFALSYPVRLAYLWSTCDLSPWAAGGALHRIAQLQFVVLVMLIGLGMYVSRRQWRVAWPLWCLALYLTILHSVFHVEPRYSLPARPVLFVFAAAGLQFGYDRIRTRARERSFREVSLTHEAGS